MPQHKLLVVDDEADMRAAVEEALARKGYEVDTAGDGREALEKLSAGDYRMVVSDVKMPGLDGMELLREVKRTSPHTPVLLITAFGTVQKAVAAVKEGAVDFILKPFSLEALEATVEKTLRDQAGIEAFEAEGKHMLTTDQGMRKVISMAQTAADSDATVLVSGESGTGKELIARFIHESSPRKQKPFVAVNCASIPEGLLESELFGHEKGAFTGAHNYRQGKFEQADAGTILLDEISEMDLKLQAKLLRVIQEREVERLGGKTPVKLDIRIIATTNRDMATEVREGRFREDLFYRLNIFPITLPPLRERTGDIPRLAEHFVRTFSTKYSRHVEEISTEAMEWLKGREWRGNIREMENTMERAVLLTQGRTIGTEHLAPGPGPSGAAEPASVTTVSGPSGQRVVNGGDNPVTLKEMERDLITKTLNDVEWNRTQAARILGISVRTLRNKLKEYGQVVPG